MGASVVCVRWNKFDADTLIASFMKQCEGVALMSAFLHVRGRLLYVETPASLVQLLGAWRVHLLDQEAESGDQETPRFVSLSGSLATPRQLNSTPQ